ncbi:hypothetical protein GALL_17690 [mine drainage metagenome]|uniref:Putative DNA-binding domain-containing protein n=1 Tax=mine drainage metagenome TaxID=410659 RepID=A0A1J5TQA1_9ZZZZ
MLHEELANFARAIVRGEMPSPRINQAYTNFSAEAAIGVYRNNYRGNLHDALAGAYPVVKLLVGDDFFRFLAKRYIEQHPSCSANLHHFGSELADFIAAFEPAKELVYLPDVAALEWACHVAYFVDDGIALDIGKLAQVAPERYSDLVLHTHPSCQVVRSPYPVAAIWHAHQPGAPEDFHIDLDGGPGYALVSRKDDIVRVSELTGAEAIWLERVQAGISLGDATAETLALNPGFDLQGTLLKLMAQNIFTTFNVGATP